MSFASFLYHIIVLPIESIIEFVFCFTLSQFELLGVAGAIVAVSLAVNFLALPIYNVADDIQLKERELQKKMKHWVTHIKAHFKGDEQFMRLSTYYRQNNYHPLYALRQSLSILIQIPFFMAAYNFLSHCHLLEHQSILFLKDLSQPDALINIGGFTLNFLPILMTAINIASAIVYTRGAPLREKIQTYVLAGIFLFLLYNSPSGLVFYWVLNQIFSLCKNIVKKTKHPVIFVYAFFLILFLFIFIYFEFFSSKATFTDKTIAYSIMSVIVLTVAIVNVVKLKKNSTPCKNPASENSNLFLLAVSCVSLALLCGLLLPASTVATSPGEFSFLGEIDSPLKYIWSALAMYIGLFVFWPLLIYKMFGDHAGVKSFMPPILFTFTVGALANALLFKYDYGIISTYFKLDDPNRLHVYNIFYTVMPVLLVAAALALFFVLKKFKLVKILSFAMLAISLAEIFVGASKVKIVSQGFAEATKIHNEQSNSKNENVLQTEFHLSKNHKNVVILFLDRAISAFFPYIIEQFPELNKSLEGFTYFPNCLSFGGNTINASAPLLGGYDYIPQELGKSPKTILEKQNDALLVLPQNFHQAGYDVQIANLPYANGKFYMDLSFFEQQGYIDAKNLANNYSEKYISEHPEVSSSADPSVFVCKNMKEFSVLQMIYPPLRRYYYREGVYYTQWTFFQGAAFVESYSELYYLPQITDFESETSSFVFFANNTCHNSLNLAAPDYRPANFNNVIKPLGVGPYDYVEKTYDYESYQPNAAAILLIAKWMDYLKENGVYDNTRIIIVSDHGYVHTNRRFAEFKKIPEATNFNPLLLFKDFDSRGMPKTDNKLITNAETPYLATMDLPVLDENPFTKNKFRRASYYDYFEVVKISELEVNPHWWIDKIEFKNNKTQHFTVHDSIFDESNWTRLEKSEAEK